MFNKRPPAKGFRPDVPDAMRIEDAMGRSTALAHLQQLLRESQARLEAVRAVLPAALMAHVKPGPVDGHGWSLLVANAAVASKLRQLQPRMEAALRQRGWQVTAIRIRVQSG